MLIEHLELAGLASCEVKKSSGSMPGTGLKLVRKDGKKRVLCVASQANFVEWLEAIGTLELEHGRTATTEVQNQRRFVFSGKICPSRRVRVWAWP